MSDRDSIKNTFLVTGLLCFVCSILVSGAAVGLKDKQDSNKALDLKKNILNVCGIDYDDSNVESIYGERIQTRLIDLRTGETVAATPTSQQTAEAFMLNKLQEDEETTLSQDPAGIGGTRENFAVVYLYEAEKQIILPIRGKGLWSTLWGFISLSDGDFTTRGITFYSHGETPGLGGEVDSPFFKNQFVDGKETLNADGQVVLNVTKSGAAGPNDIDGLAGATITTQGVDKLIKFWLGMDGFGNYLQVEDKFANASN